MNPSTEPRNADGSIGVSAQVGELISSGVADRGDHPFADGFVFHAFDGQVHEAWDIPAMNAVRPCRTRQRK